MTNDIYKKIVGHEKVAEKFGRWPSFHDSEVMSIRVDRDEGKALTTPVLTAEFHLFDIAVPPNSPLRNDTITTLRFRDIDEFEMSDFNQQNAISDLVISGEYCERLKREVFNVEFKQGFGIYCSFQCSTIEVISIEPFTPKWGAWAR